MTRKEFPFGLELTECEGCGRTDRTPDFFEFVHPNGRHIDWVFVCGDANWDECLERATDWYDTSKNDYSI